MWQISKKCSRFSIDRPMICEKSACWSIEYDNMHSALYYNRLILTKSTKMDKHSDSNDVQYYCDHETILSSERKQCLRLQSYTKCQKPTFRDRTMMQNVKTIFLTVTIILSLVHGKFTIIIYLYYSKLI